MFFAKIRKKIEMSKKYMLKKLKESIYKKFVIKDVSSDS